MRFWASIFLVVISMCMVFSEDFQTDFLIANKSFFNKLSPGDLVEITFDREWTIAENVPTEKWSEKVYPGKKFRMPEKNLIDLDTLFDTAKEPNRAIAYLYNEFTAEADGIAVAGIGSDWWFEAACNGKIYCSTFKQGNGSGSYAPGNNRFFFPVKKGKNLLAVKVRRGSYTWSFACGEVPFFKPGPVVAELVVGPWLANPDKDEVTVRFTTAGEIPGGVEFRQAGKPETATVCWDSRGGVIRQREFHSVTLKNLQPGTDYEYRIVLLDPVDRKKAVFPQGETFYKYHCKDLNSGKFSFLFAADLQFTPEKQDQIFRQLLKAGDFASCDFIVLGGDVNNTFIPQEFYDGILKTLSVSGGSSIPAVVLRGNHELEGANPEFFNEIFGDSEGKSYWTFRWGDTAFLVFDSFSESPQLERNGLLLGRELMAAQEKYLQTALREDSWTKAARRVAFGHNAPYSRAEFSPGMADETRRLVNPWFAGKNPQSQLALWLGAHTHYYSRSIPGKAEVVSRTPLSNRVTVTGENYTFPVITNAGPGAGQPQDSTVFRIDAEPGKLTVTVLLPDGTMMEKVEIFNDGKVKELVALPPLK